MTAASTELLENSITICTQATTPFFGAIETRSTELVWWSKTVLGDELRY